MPGEIFDFEWFVNGAGYALLQAIRVEENGQRFWKVPPKGSPDYGTGEWIISAKLPENGHIFPDRRYNPLVEDSCLFLAFAELEPEREKILAFANRYGLLGFEVTNPTPGTIALLTPAELLSSWQDEIIAMRQALDLWKKVLSGDERGLRKTLEPYMRWIEADMKFLEGSSYSKSHDGLPDNLDPKWLRWFRMNPHCLDWFRTGNMKMPARNRIQTVINEQLIGRVSPRVLWDDPSRTHWGLYFVPNCLAGALWLQLAQAITHYKDYRRCRQCNGWFEIDHYMVRSNRLFCSNACRSKAYRERQNQAQRLFRKGLDPEEIAAKLGSEKKAVIGWISGSKTVRD